jgi:hypothetical protein
MTEQSNNLVEKNKARETNDKKKRGGKDDGKREKNKGEEEFGTGESS